MIALAVGERRDERKVAIEREGEDAGVRADDETHLRTCLCEADDAVDDNASVGDLCEYTAIRVWRWSRIAWSTRLRYTRSFPMDEEANCRQGTHCPGGD